MEGIGCILDGIWGTGNGTTTYSQNVGALGITKVELNYKYSNYGYILNNTVYLGRTSILTEYLCPFVAQ